MKYFFAIIPILLTLLADLLSGNLGFSVSLTVCALIYFSGVTGRSFAFVSAIAAGLFLDMCYARGAAFSPLVLLLSVITGSMLVPDTEHRTVLTRSLPAGAVACGVFVISNAVTLNCIYGKSGYPSSVVAHLITSMLSGLICYPLMIIILDAISARLDLQKYLSGNPADISIANSSTGHLPYETASGRRKRK